MTTRSKKMRPLGGKVLIFSEQSFCDHSAPVNETDTSAADQEEMLDHNRVRSYHEDECRRLARGQDRLNAANRKEEISAHSTKRQDSNNCTENRRVNMHLHTLEETKSKRRNHPINSSNFDRFCKLTLVIITILYLFAGCCLIQPGAAQCPWTRDAAELHSDCICDFNPSLTTNLEQEQRPINRMSVQCSPVNFQQLLRALKQTASIELPNQLISSSSDFNIWEGNNSEEFRLAAAQLASQAKLDLLHVSNSTIRLLVNNTFIISTANFADSLSSTNGSSVSETTLTAPLEGRHLVVAIQSLHLSRCAIEDIQPGAFNGLEWSLTSLSLSDNLLEQVPIEALRRLVNLKVLDLSNNRLLRLQANSFGSLSKLNTLRLADNRLGQRQPGSNQQTNISQQTIDADAFSGLEATLTDLNLKNTHLEVFPSAIKSLRQLAFLNLAQNQISQIPSRSFESTQSLTAINLERNRISRLEEDTFVGVESSLSSLSLLGNLLEVFPAQQLANLSSMRRLDMGFNRIESLPDDAFASNKQLILIALDGNPLETLPETAFKPLEGTLRGMSVGGKSLNCDCRLSWMLRWQQEFSIQISSREREPQFCAKPHYLRSLVSFAALKPEHLTCLSVGTNSPQITTSYIPILPRNSTSTGWTVNTNEPVNLNTIRSNQQTSNAYFTLPVQFEPTLSESTRAPTSMSSLWLARTEPSEPVVYMNSYATTTTPTEISPPTTTINPPTINLASTTTTTSLLNLDEDATERSASSLAATFVPEETTMNAIQTSTDLIEAATNNEPSDSRDDDITVTSETTLPRYWTPPVHNRTSASRPAFGERTSIGGLAYIATLPVTDSTVSNLPEDELFVTDTSKKQSRHGFLPAMRPKQAPPIMPLEATLRRWTENITTISGSANQRDLQDVDWRRSQTSNRTYPFGAEQNARLQPVSATTGTQTRKPIVQSVFGSRAGDNTSTTGTNKNVQQGRQNMHAAKAGQRVQNSSNNLAISAGNNHSIVPAIPTTINVYRTSHQLYNQSSQPMQSISSSSSRQHLGHLLKGARFVDEQPLPIAPQSGTTRPSKQVPLQNVAHQYHNLVPNTTTSANATSIDVVPSRIAEPELERYTIAASNNVHSRVTPTGVSVGFTTPSTRTQTVEPQSPTTPNSNQQGYLAHLARSSAPNNTRMSVSSIYRLATSLPQPARQSSTTPAPTTTTSASPQVTDGNTINDVPIDSINAARRHFNQYGHLARNVGPDSRRLSTSSNTSALTETATPAHDNVLARLFPNRVTWRSSTAPPPIISSTTSTTTTTVPPTTTTSKPADAIASQASADGNGTTTRMAATVRFVDNSPVAIKQQVSANPASGYFNISTSTTTTSTTTTPRPTSIVLDLDDFKTETQAANNQLIASTTRFTDFPGSVSNKSTVSNGNGMQSISASPFDSEGSIPSLNELINEKIRPNINSFRKDQRAIQTDQPQVNVNGNQMQQVDRGSQPFLDVGEQRHEARIIISSNKQSSGHSTIVAGSGSSPVERASTINLVTKDNYVPRQARDEPAINNSTGGGGGLATTNVQHSSIHPARFFVRLAKMADFDQLALILAALLCLFILILALTIICICYSSWSAKRRKSGAASRLSSFSSSSASGSAGHQRQVAQVALFGSASIKHRAAVSKGNFLQRFICCCLSGKKRHDERRAPTRSLVALQDDDNLSGGSSQGLKTSGKSMLLANSQTTLSNQELLFESIRRASMRLAGAQNQLTSKPFKNGNESGKKTRRRRSYCEQISASSNRDQPIDHEASMQRHLEAHQMDQEYFVGLAAAARTTGRRRSTTIGALSMKTPFDSSGTNKRSTQRLEEPTDDWIKDDTLSSCDSDKSCSPGANRNNRYNISEAHRAYLGSKNANQIQASMFVTTSGQTIQKSGLLKTIDALHGQHDQKAHLDYFDRDSRLSSDKSTTDDSRTPLNQKTSRPEYKTNRPTHLHQAVQHVPQSTLRTATTTRSFGIPVARSRSIGRLQEFPPASNFKPNNLAQVVTGGNRGNNISSAEDYLISDLIPISAEEQWPEPYVDPADDQPSMMAMSSKERILFAHNQPNTSYPQQQPLRSHKQPNQFAPAGPQRPGANHETFNEDTRRRTQTHRRTASAHRVAYDDAYLANWHTMSRGAKRAVPAFGVMHQHSVGDQQNGEPISAGNYSSHGDSERVYNEHGSQFPTSLVRYRSIPSLNEVQSVQGQQVFNGQLMGATNWLRWTPSTFASREAGTRDNNTMRYDPQSDSPQQATNSSTNATRSTNRSVAEQSTRNWNRDNHVESMYVAASQQR